LIAPSLLRARRCRPQRSGPGSTFLKRTGHNLSPMGGYNNLDLLDG
jgi:hypothetical protein